MTLRTFLLIIGINAILIFVANLSQARPTNYCTNNQYAIHTDKITKTENLYDFFLRFNPMKKSSRK